MKYRVGWPFWRTLATWGLPVHINVQVHWDAESKSFWASSTDIDGLVVSGMTPEELRDEVIGAAASLLEVQQMKRPFIPDMNMCAAA